VATEAVIISGPRRGELVTLPEALLEEPPADLTDALRAAIRELDAALVSALEEMRAWRADMHRSAEDGSHG